MPGTTAGSVFQRSDGRWCASLKADGRRKDIYARSESEAKKKLADLQRTVGATGNLPLSGTRTLSDLLSAWLDASRDDLKPSTIFKYEALIRLHVAPGIGRVRLSKLEPAHFQRLYASLQARGLKRVPAHLHAMMLRACRIGVMWRWLAENPCERVLKPRYTAPRKEVWSADQARSFLTGTLQHCYGSLFSLGIFSGARLGEMLALKWDDVDFSAGTICINKTVARLNRQWVVSTPKTASGVRVITLPPEAMAALRRQRARQNKARLASPEWQDEGRVFANLRGTCLNFSTVEHALGRECERLGLPIITPHGFRHASASLLLAAGIPITDVSKRLGHANPSITLSIYAHALPGRDHLASDALATALG